MFKRLLIANRGEIACRIIRTARRLGIETVAVYSDADSSALHVERADAAVHIGSAPATESYLSVEKIIGAASSAGADAIHPGYGFLSESARFADACSAAGLVFVGPPADAMRRLGDKASAKILAREAQIPVVPGYDGHAQADEVLAGEAERIGFPLLIKAVAGGGGRGMRRVDTAGDFAAMLASARREAMAAFGDERVILERLIERPRHIEVQVFADRHGNVVHMFERECTLQRRHQKVIEEAPAAAMSSELRTNLTDAATALARAARYEGAGTVEFLVEGGILSSNAGFYFIEMNTRLQVEHPVTEAITGLDLVEWQLRVAAGEPLPISQDEIAMHGHAVEARLCAEDPSAGFRPSTGPIIVWSEPVFEGLRVDAGFEAGRLVPPDYDSLLAKVITHGDTRSAAIAAAAGALSRFHVAGPRTNASFLHRLLTSPEFATADIDTGLIDRGIARFASRESSPAAAAAGVRVLLEDRAAQSGDAWSAGDAFQLGVPRTVRYAFVVDGEPQSVSAAWDGDAMRLMVAGGTFDGAELETAAIFTHGPCAYVLYDLAQTVVAWPDWNAETEAGEAGSRIVAPITGRIAAIAVRAGENVERGATIAIVEAMKMEHIVQAPRDGIVAAVLVSPGEQVAAGQVIATYDEEAGA
ncbi:MAG: hypothetical protein RLZ98_532 [Pseudomonadota bacterium]|jgi:3-methylcrotonyl-CoA carboxylase alpha subunit